MQTVRVRAWNGLEQRFGVPFPVFSPWLVWAMWRQVRRADLVHIHDPLYLTSWVAASLVPAAGDAVRRASTRGLRAPLLAVVRMVQQLVLGTLGRLVLRGAAGDPARSMSTSPRTREPRS